ncbi:hypothetical protein H310_02000 [Aphanomyces invadans]|uniref:Uncharacterized protein n=1 Tax=Aphanomyces invadans TaxID=157072 RepID=A0A024UPF6_9STRA|nr:hypothetical protein H310_02000 [Aphanomyces invadans]ETW07493.1 hypothetical protein H310_02000 [Aphanomyces invadans]|eukprot:XP_008863586.1 hypothetical protein H310_02000 [Aphanomyces invadans]
MNTIFTQCEASQESARASSPYHPVFTCEVCKISMRSAKKLEDHVNHSPLHRAALNESDPAFKMEMSGRLSSESDRPCSPCRQRLIYDGTKLFWRVNETLELHIYEAVNANLVTVIGQIAQQKKKLPPLVLDLAILQAVTSPEGIKASSDANQASSQRDAIVKFILARLQAVKDGNDGSLSLYLQKQNGDKVDPTRTVNDLPAQVVSDTAPRRRHTYEDACVVQNEVQSHTKALKSSRQTAERCHDMARLSLNAFIDLEEVVKARPKDKGDHLSWLGAFNRVRQRTDIEVIKAKMQTGHHNAQPQTKSSETTPEEK